MKRFAWMSLLVLLCACDRGGPDAPAEAASPAPATTARAPERAPAAEPAFVLPGSFSQATTLDDLRTMFGSANVTISEFTQEDGTTGRSVVLFADDPTRRAYVDFHDTEALTDVANIAVRDAGSRWRGKGGVHVGMSFADLRRANDWPFLFSGFDNEHRGWVRDQWSPSHGDDSRLGALDVGEADHMYFGVDLGLRDAAAAIPAADYPHDDSLSSDDPRYPRLGEIAEVTAFNASTSLDDEWQ